MQTSINNDERVFMVTGVADKKVLCNLEQLPDAIRHIAGTHGKTYKVQHCWNLKFVRISKQDINDMFKLAGIAYKMQ